MKVRIVLCMAAVLCVALVAQSVRGDTSGSAVAMVRVTVNPNVSITPVNATVNAGTVQMGDFSASIDFTVNANEQDVSFSAAASPLYKGGDPTNSQVNPIPLKLSAGVVITPANGNAMGGHGNTLAFVTSSSQATVQNFPVQTTEIAAFSSSQNNHFSQNVNAVVTWTQVDPEQPTGEYDGVVQLTALLLPP